MRRLAQHLWASLRQRDPHGRATRVALPLEVETLEQRAVPTSSATAAVTGTAFVDHNGTGIFSPGDAPIVGLTVTLGGTSSLGKSVVVTTTTDANGSFTFLNVPKGTYQLATATLNGYLGGSLTVGGIHAPNGVNVLNGVSVGTGQHVGASATVSGLAPQSISLAQFLSSATDSAFPSSGSPGPGSIAATGPFVKTPISSVTLAKNGSQVVDLAANFTAPDITNSTVRFDVTAGTFKGSIDLTTFDSQAPQTVQNFLDYIKAGDYTNAPFTRLVQGFVLQGGGTNYKGSPPNASLDPVEKLPSIANEFGILNTTNTLAMAQSGGDINSANNEFFINLTDNTSLDTQKFAVFAKLATGADATTLTKFMNTANQNINMSSSPAATNNPGVVFDNVPLVSYGGSATTFASDATASNFLMITHAGIVSQNEVLTYTVTSSNSNIATAALTPKAPERVTVTGKSAGTAIITVVATDQYGNTASSSFTVTIH
jgi:cyclophilin family peptidyl-prolyl cis-trans isomerase